MHCHQPPQQLHHLPQLSQQPHHHQQLQKKSEIRDSPSTQDESLLILLVILIGIAVVLIVVLFICLLRKEEQKYENTNSIELEPELKHAKNCVAVKCVGEIEEHNPKWRPTMEDAHVIIDQFGFKKDQAYFAVYDGHGGREVVDFLALELHDNILEEIEKSDDSVDQKESISIPTAIRQGFLKTDDIITKNKSDFPKSGSTAVVAFLRKEGEHKKLYTANVGDARCVISRGGVAHRLSFDHKASDASEQERIQKLGSFLILGKVGGSLAISRAFGDIDLKKYVPADPYMAETTLNDDDEFMILACDGLWDVCEDQAAVDLVAKMKDPQRMAEKLMNHALDTSRDNITIIVVIF